MKSARFGAFRHDNHFSSNN